jgi:hypothetical protein
LIATDERDFAKIATELATSEGSRKQTHDAIAAAIGDATAPRFAQMLEERAIQELTAAEGSAS